MNLDSIGLNAFLSDYPNMSVAVTTDGSTDLVLNGTFDFAAKFKDGQEVRDSYSLEIRVPEKFPVLLPKVFELNNRIRRDGTHHTHKDGALCLGSPLRLRILAKNNPSLSGFASNCIVPFLYWISSNQFSVGELEHGGPGLEDDYMSLFGLSDPKQVVPALKLLGMKKRVANKKPCPCGCGVRLGRCNKRFILNQYRSLSPRWWFREHIKTFGEKSD